MCSLLQSVFAFTILEEQDARACSFMPFFTNGFKEFFSMCFHINAPDQKHVNSKSYIMIENGEMAYCKHILCLKKYKNKVTITVLYNCPTSLSEFRHKTCFKNHYFNLIGQGGTAIAHYAQKSLLYLDYKVASISTPNLDSAYAKEKLALQMLFANID